MNAWATTIISGLVLVVAFMQWRTAHQKVLLDLFERRLRVYGSVTEAMEMFSSAGPLNISLEARMKLQIAMSEARFLFGDEVLLHIETLIDDMSQIIAKVRRIDSQTVAWPTREKLIDEVVNISNRIDGWREPFSKLCYPYMRMDQKRVLTPGEWLQDRNCKRLSYADEKQK
ncbi:hypothetical protein H009_14638 [Agrobacterium tumefaciens str. Cherry 2E-2-2]|nr:hypothetical protein H009_14638 [Agrobacterium tumefaciens str. Cherry 2E-2-2]